MAEDNPIELVPYSPAWAALFASEVAVLRSALAPWLVAEPEHIGSTAVPGMAAKPIIDIMAPVASLQGSRSAIEAARTIGYCYFPYKPEQMHWFCKPSPAHRTHHLHLIEYRGTLWQERIAFRDALRVDQTLAARYEELKSKLANEHRFDREAYTEGKAQFVQAAINNFLASGRGAA